MTAPNYYGKPLPEPGAGEERPGVVEAHKAVERTLNTFNEQGANELAYLLAYDHRTLVQNAMRDLVVPFILWLAFQYDEDRYDARNEGACRLAASLRDVINGPHGFPMPTI
jgi:hypothetical protein